MKLDIHHKNDFVEEGIEVVDFEQNTNYHLKGFCAICCKFTLPCNVQIKKMQAHN